MKDIKERVWGADDFYGPKHLFRQNKMLSLLKRRVKRGCILDAGCGKGEQSIQLLKEGFEVVAVEINDENLNSFKNKLNKLNFNSKIRLIKSELETLELERNSLDGILCGEVLEHVQDDGKVLRNFNLFLKKDGHCIITSPLNEKYWNIDDEWAGHYRRYSLELFTTLIENSGFKIEKINFYGPILNQYFYKIYLPILKRKLENYNSNSLPKKNLFISFLKNMSKCFYFLFYIDDLFKYPPDKAIYFLADIRKIKEL